MLSQPQLVLAHKGEGVFQASDGRGGQITFGPGQVLAALYGLETYHITGGGKQISTSLGTLIIPQSAVEAAHSYLRRI